MTNAIIRRGLQLLRLDGRGKDRKLILGQGWAVSVVTNIDLEMVPNWHEQGDAQCPECQQKPVTCVWEMWENTTTENDFRHIDYFWCGNAHMWIATESYHEQVLSGQWDR
ncbi:hypothetical protein CKJ55_21680 [Mycobacterium avium]|uniref:Uncharacterized protein n=2 Tax=Mycobacterium avium TaxID=1764 RepID=A0A2A2ZCW9_MYCAV|nr:hypothetical protein [Mycobacterium avium]MCA4732916.1 hypothetical protein [Mycobacterium avium subsp. hominissuis]MCA4741368.1 hypothetical protein [Mycobacterium avium subsp. hominissuis]MCA4746187.1 hypothetical protein [Mycobacterium avium subsp. hominissuis]PBA24243.1 hypothetical protein CKJ66_24065 [Mycobacterium avium]PBA39360.1 hypothetical protein CKJ63_22485 [Mycobacterium avium]